MKDYLYYRAINWNEIEDTLDQYTWQQMVANFWLDTRVPVIEDKTGWEALAPDERDALAQSLADLATLESFQSEISLPTLQKNRRTQEESSVFNNMTFMASVHAKSMSTILLAFQDKAVVKALFKNAGENPQLQAMIATLRNMYDSDDVLEKQAANVIITTCLTYVHLFDLFELSQAYDLKNITFIGELIIRDNAIAAIYTGHKFKLNFNEATPTQQAHIQDKVTQVLQSILTQETARLTANSWENQYQNDVLSLLQLGIDRTLTLLGLENSMVSVFKATTPSTTYTKINAQVVDENQFTHDASQYTVAQHNTENMDSQDYNF